MISHQDTFDSESDSGGSAVPGAESNDGTVEVYPDSGTTSSTQSETSTDYLPNESINYKVTPAGSIDYSSPPFP